MEQPIVFVEDGEFTVPVAVLGLNDNNNLFLDDTGHWDGRYVPAYLRMYPFILAPRSDQQGYTVCIDAEYPGFSQQVGTALFDDQGEQSEFTQKAIAFASEYQRQREQSLEFSARLKELELLEPASVAVNPGAAGKITVGGFLTVSREKLANLDNDQVSRLFGQGQLESIFLQLASIGNSDNLSRRLKRSHENAEQVA